MQYYRAHPILRTEIHVSYFPSHVCLFELCSCLIKTHYSSNQHVNIAKKFVSTNRNDVFFKKNFKKIRGTKKSFYSNNFTGGTKEFQLLDLDVELLFFRFSCVHRGPWTVDHSQLELVLT